jgi:hypothetical protein
MYVLVLFNTAILLKVLVTSKKSILFIFFRNANEIESLDSKVCFSQRLFFWRPEKLSFGQGCHIFLGPKYQNGRRKYTKLPQNIPNGHKIFPMAVK